jgi:hypothetical protein
MFIERVDGGGIGDDEPCFGVEVRERGESEGDDDMGTGGRSRFMKADLRFGGEA